MQNLLLLSRFSSLKYSGFNLLISYTQCDYFSPRLFMSLNRRPVQFGESLLIIY